IGQRFAIGADLPLVLYQHGTRPLPPTVSQVDATPTTGIGDVALSMKGALLRNEGGGLGVAALGSFTIPTGDRANFASEGSVTAGARVLVEYTLLV
ncbi:transporter, partial [Salmonella enterica]|uniref:transporter n=1 Tax=Salmonella enterica TaxID=28901 RepID=UPI001654A067